MLRRRFTETRRRHPLADRPGVVDALAAERELMAPLKAAADLRDRHLGPVAARPAAAVDRPLRGRAGPALASPWSRSPIATACRARPTSCSTFASSTIRTMSTSCAAGPGRDSRGAGAHPADPALRAVRGRRAAAAAAAAAALPREGKSYLTIAFGCSGGRHRSVFLAELLGQWLRERGWEADHGAPGPRHGRSRPAAEA